MSETKNIVWLASYPKSGNKWFRIFLTALLNPEEAININKLNKTYHYSDHNLFELATGLNASELQEDELNSLKPNIANYISGIEKNTVFVKIHEAFHRNSEGKPNIPFQCTKIVLYFIRNPLDIAVSFAHHLNKNVDDVIDRMGESSTLASLENGSEFFNLPERIGSWSEHVESWLSSGHEVIVIKYEDMHNDPLKNLSKVIKALGFKYTNSEIYDALEKSSFVKIKDQEKKQNFNEKPSDIDSFFRKGKVNSYKTELSKQQINRISFFHKDIMTKFNY